MTYPSILTVNVLPFGQSKLCVATKEPMGVSAAPLGEETWPQQRNLVTSTVSGVASVGAAILMGAVVDVDVVVAILSSVVWEKI